MDKLPKDSSYVSLAVPFSIRIFKKCVENNIDMSLVKHLHFYDLQCLIMQFECDRIREYLQSKERDSLHKQGISEVRTLTGAEALKFLGR